MNENLWTEEQLKFLRDNYATMNLDDLGWKLDGRSGNAVVKKARELGLKCKNAKWEEDEIAVLIKYKDELRPCQIVGMLPRPRKYISVKKKLEEIKKKEAQATLANKNAGTS